VTSPHGMLDTWALANSGWKKRLATLLYERSCLSAAACIHALSEAEADSIRAFGLRKPVCVIPNGVDPIAAPGSPPPWKDSVPAGAKVLLYLGRMHPKKGLDLLLEGWGRASNDLKTGEWHLVIAGWDQNAYLSKLVQAARGLPNRDTVHFLPPLYGAEKAAALTGAEAFVLASRSEGLPMAALEAWAAARPVLMTPQCNLPEGFAAGAAVAIEPHAISVAAGLRQLCSMGDQQRDEMGRRGLQLVERRFTWGRSAASLIGVYRWLLRDGPVPSCVILPGAPIRTSMPSVTSR
jgi:glycosyltransferase involved in cell wall biosynthesis